MNGTEMVLAGIRAAGNRGVRLLIAAAEDDPERAKSLEELGFELVRRLREEED